VISTRETATSLEMVYDLRSGRGVPINPVASEAIAELITAAIRLPALGTGSGDLHIPIKIAKRALTGLSGRTR
jgi:hypothetical protein